MKKKILHITILVLGICQGCKDFTSEAIYSVTGEYYYIAKVNRTDKNAINYAEPIFHVYDAHKSKIGIIETHAGDFSKWEVGWSDFGNFILLNSSDVGVKVWKVEHDKIEEVEPTAEQFSEALYLLGD